MNTQKVVTGYTPNSNEISLRNRLNTALATIDNPDSTTIQVIRAKLEARALQQKLTARMGQHLNQLSN